MAGIARLLGIAACVLALVSTAQAHVRYHHLHHHHRHHFAARHVARSALRSSRTDRFYREVRLGGERQSFRRALGEILPHPAGCPRTEFCGCGAAVEIFGTPIRALWLAANWLRFPRAEPGYHMAAVRQHHVMVIREYLGGERAIVYDANSGHHLTRIHEVSLVGYRIVDPRGGS